MANLLLDWRDKPKTETFLRGHKMKRKKKTWMQDVAGIVAKMPHELFHLSAVYKRRDFLQRRHPDNHNVDAKIRQCVQRLRDQGYLAPVPNCSGVYLIRNRTKLGLFSNK